MISTEFLTNQSEFGIFQGGISIIVWHIWGGGETPVMDVLRNPSRAGRVRRTTNALSGSEFDPTNWGRNEHDIQLSPPFPPPLF